MKMIHVVMGMCLLALATAARADVKVEKHVPSNHSNGKVEIDAGQGSLEIIGWDKNEVEITGTVGDQVDRIDVSKGNRKVKVRAFVPKEAEGRDVHLVIRAPHNNDINVQVFQGPVTVSGIEGDIDLETFSGKISVSGACKRVEASSVNGDIVIEPDDSEFSADKVRVKTVAGAITIRNVRREVEAQSISGAVTISGSTLNILSVKTVSGDVRFDGGIASSGQVRIETHGGNIAGSFPTDFTADFDITSYNGRVENAFRSGAEIKPEAVRGDGNQQADVRATSFSGDIRLTRQPKIPSTTAQVEKLSLSRP